MEVLCLCLHRCALRRAKMISLEAYRARIGVFLIRGSRSQNLTKGSGFEEVDATLYFLRNFGICIIILILTLNLNFAVLKLLKLLVDGDVESNPGPTTFNPLKVVQGSFHQGNPNLVILPEYNAHATPYLQYVGLLLNL